jgi:predicted HicB family RNase H-like nuclease
MRQVKNSLSTSLNISWGLGMKNIMRYKGYLARISFDETDGVFVGDVLGLSEEISFHGASVDELRGDFEFAIDHYISVCREAGINPQKQAGGSILLRLAPETHVEAIIAAQAEGLSLNDWLVRAVEQAAPKNATRRR